MTAVVELPDPDLRRFVTRCRSLVFDYDGTLAESGRVDGELWHSLEAVRATGRRVLLASGRRVESLLDVCPRLDMFDLVVAENGAVLYWPASSRLDELSGPPPVAFLGELQRLGIAYGLGRSVVGIPRRHAARVLCVIERGYPMLRMSLNKADAMVSRYTVNKGSGLVAATASLGVERVTAMAFGDAENDIALFEAAGYGVATANALDEVKRRADFVLGAAHPQGIAAFLQEHFLRGEGLP
jgi:hydroxymethylpyrimidine pyrophosphatase-like HAD family hydrolase